MTKRKDLSKALDQAADSQGTHNVIDFKPQGASMPRTDMVQSMMTLSQLMILYMDVRTAAKQLMELHDFRQEPDTDVHPTNKEWFEALQRLESALMALHDFEVAQAGPKAEFPSGGISKEQFEANVYSRSDGAPLMTRGPLRDEEGNIVEDEREWHQRPQSELKTRKQIELEYKCNATCEDIGCQCGREAALKRHGLA